MHAHTFSCKSIMHYYMQMLYAVESARSAKCILCASWCIPLSEHLRTVFQEVISSSEVL